jgi:hypothetical protein
MPTTRKRKPVSAARIELSLRFTDELAYRAFSAVPLGRKSTSVSDREWVLPVVLYPDGHIEARFQFTHTCRNDGAQRGDSEKFFRAVCNAAHLRDDAVQLADVKLLSDKNFPEPEQATPAPTQAGVAPVPYGWTPSSGSFESTVTPEQRRDENERVFNVLAFNTD